MRVFRRAANCRARMFAGRPRWRVWPAFVLAVVVGVLMMLLPGSGGVGAAIADGPTVVPFSYTGSDQSWTVPAGVTSVLVVADGPQGAGAYGGLGGRTTATLAVTPGEVLHLYVGGAGVGATGGYNGGGDGESGDGAGGGATDVRVGGTALADRVLVAGGGGGEGSGAGATAGAGGSGGGLTGEAGEGGNYGGGGGGSQSAGGSGGGSSGSLGAGGDGGYAGGAGGGGYYGGGGGASGLYAPSGGGGGGSSYADPSAIDPVFVRGYQSGVGDLSITYDPAVAAPDTPGSGSHTFNYTGSPQTWTVPDGVTAMHVQAFGGSGYGTYGGFGGETQATVPVVPGQTVTVVVGGEGSTSAGGYNGGGNGDAAADDAGGGASDVRVGGTSLADRVVVAGGGGGEASGANEVYGQGGSGGATGEAGGSGDQGGAGGSQTAGGSAGGLGSTAGSLGVGGSTVWKGGAGGGGYYGGGAGGSSSAYNPPPFGGGGGGSSWAKPGATAVQYVTGTTHDSDGQVILSWPQAAPTAPSPSSATDPLTASGVPQYWTVPAAVTQIGVIAAGGQADGSGGLGGGEEGVVPVQPDQVVMVVVAGAGSGSSGGFGGGGHGFEYATGGGGGGASDVRVGGQTLADRVLVAAGGGGTNNGGSGGAGGDGGGLTGAAGTAGSGGGGGGGGGQSAGGAAGTGTNDEAGSLGKGGDSSYSGGGGGGGYYGGGSGGMGSIIQSAGGGGGGSSYAIPTANQVHTAAGVQTGDGTVTIQTGADISTNGALGNYERPGVSNLSEGDNAVCSCGDPVDTEDGAYAESFTDLEIPGRGFPLDLARTYSSALAATPGPFGYGWSSSYTVSLNVSGTTAIVDQENGSQVEFDEDANSNWIAAPRVQASLVEDGGGTWTFTRENTETFTFNSGGQLTSEADLNGNTTDLAYDGSGRLHTVTDPAGRTLTFAYSGAGTLVQSVTDSSGRSVSYGYDGSDNLTSVTDVRGGITAFTYYSGHLLETMLDPNQHGSGSPHPLTNIYDGSGRVTSQTDPVGRETDFDYTTISGSTIVTNPDGSKIKETFSGGQLSSKTTGYGTGAAETTSYTYDPTTFERTSVTDPNGNVTVFTYDAQGNLTSATNPLGNISTTTYNQFGEPVTSVDPAGITTTDSYDGSGNLTSRAISGAGGSPTETTSYSHSDGSHPDDVTRITDPAGHVTDFTYDTDGDVITTTTNPASMVTDETDNLYNSLGEKVCETSPNATATSVVCPAIGDPRVADTSTWTYDAAGDITATEDAEGKSTTNVYDADGNQTQVTDPVGNVTANTYDLDNELTAATSGYGTGSAATTDYGYQIAPGNGSCSGGVTGAVHCDTVTDPDGHVAVSYYNVRGDKIEETQPSSGTTTYTYDPADNLATKMSSAGTATYGYDAANEELSVSYGTPAGGYDATPDVTYSYDPDGKRTSMDDGTGTSLYTYDSLERLTDVTDGNDDTTSYGYDDDNTVSSITYPGGHTITYGYNNAEQPTSVEDWLSHATTLTPDHDGNTTAEGLPNGDTSTSTFNRDDQVTAISDAPTSTPGSPFATFSYTRNDDEQVASETDTGTPGTASQSYAYDPLNRLGSASTDSYGYDDAGQATSHDTTPAGGGGSTVTNSYNSSSQLTSSRDGTLPTLANGATLNPTVTFNSGYQHSSAIDILVAPAGANKPVVVETAGVSADSGTSATVNLQATPKVGHLLVAVIAWTSAPSPFGTPPPTPSGWTRIANVGNSTTTDNRLSAFYHVVATGETAKSFTFTVYSSGTDNSSAVIYEVAGQDSSPIDTYGVATGNGSSVSDSVTSSQANDLALLTASVDFQWGPATISPSSGWALDQTTTTDGTQGNAIDAYSYDAGTALSPTVTLAGNDWNDSAIALAINPAGGSKPTVVQSASHQNSSSSASITVTLGSTPTVGNLEVAFVSWYGDGSGYGDPPATPSGWTRVLDQADEFNWSDNISAFERVVPTSPSASTAFTVYDSSTAKSAAVVYEIAGQAPAAIDTAAGTGSNDEHIISPSLTITKDNALVLLGVTADKQNEAPVISQGHQWALDQVSSTNLADSQVLDSYSDRGGEVINPTISLTGAFAHSAALSVLVAPASSSEPTIVRTTGAHTTSAGATITVTRATAPTADDLEIAFVSWTGAPSPGYDDPPATPSGWTRIADAGNQYYSPVEVTAFERTVPSGAGTSTTFTVYDSSTDTTSAVIYEISGQNSNNPIDQYEGAKGNATSITPAISATQPNDLPLIAVAPDTQSGNPSISPSTGWTRDQATTTFHNNPLDTYHRSTGTTPAATNDPTGPAAATTYTYNNTGDRSTTTPPSDDTTTYTYNQTDQLTQVDTPTDTATYTYNGDGLRNSKTVNGTTTNQTWDDGAIAGIPLLLADGTTDYVYTPDGEPLEQITGSTVHYYLHDQQGSTRLLTNSSGTVTDNYTYDPYGNLTATTGTTTNPFLYGGQYQDPETGLYYLRARYYDPAASEFLSVDPMIDVTLEPYGYLEDDPLVGVDSTGLGLVCLTPKCLADDALRAGATAIATSPAGLALDLASKATHKSIGFCISSDATVQHVNGHGSACYYATPHGNGGIALSLGSGAGAADAEVGASVGPSISNAQNLGELGGRFYYVWGSAGEDDLSGGASTEIGRDSCGSLIYVVSPNASLTLNSSLINGGTGATRTLTFGSYG